MRHVMVEKTWLPWEGARSLRSAIKERGMGVPGFGESKAHICDEDAEQLLRSLQGSAFSLVSSQRSHAVHADQFSHNKYPLLVTQRTTQIHLLLLCPTQCLSVKYHELARLAHRDHAQGGKFHGEQLFRGPHGVSSCSAGVDCCQQVMQQRHAGQERVETLPHEGTALLLL